VPSEPVYSRKLEPISLKHGPHPAPLWHAIGLARRQHTHSHPGCGHFGRRSSRQNSKQTTHSAMKVTRHIHKAIALAAVLIVFPVSQALAQGVAGPYPNNGQASEGKTSASIEWMKPSFDGGDGITFMTSA